MQLAGQFDCKAGRVQAIQYVAGGKYDNYEAISEFTKGKVKKVNPIKLELISAQGDVHGGDWVVRTITGVFITCSEDEFEGRYHPVA